MRRKKKAMILLLCGVIALMAVGYSILSTTLNITGRTKVMMNWSVFISDIHEIDKSHAITQHATVDSMLSASFAVDFEIPGAYAVYEVTVKNQGEMDAVLKAIKGLENQNNQGINFSVENLTIDEPLLAHTEKKFQVRVEWDKDATKVPDGPQDITIDLEYTQTEEGTGDVSAPEAKPSIEEIGTNYISINSGCQDSESGIKNIEYKEGNNEWQNGISIQTFKNLTSGSYRYQVRCTNGSGLTTTSQVIEVTTKDLETPTYTVNKEGWANQKEVTITYPSGQDNYVYEYSIDGEKTWLKTTTATTVVTFTSNGSIVARVSDGTNTKKGTVFTVDQIDSNVPSAPTLDTSQVSSDWSSQDQTIVIDSTSTSPSGLDHYEYYISTSKDGLENGTWITLGKDETNIIISSQGENYIYVREVNGAGTTGELTEPVRVRIDKTAPENIEPTGIEPTSKSITVTTTPKDDQSGITKIEFSKDGGKTWVDNGTNPNFTFDNLTTGQYDIVVRVTNGSGLTTTSNKQTVSTISIPTPTYSINTTGWATSKTVTITYPERQTDFIYEYSINEGNNWTTVESGTTVNVDFAANGSVIARVRDGVNTVTASTYTVDKIDSGTPTEPILTGGSDAWTSSSRTISISAPSTSASGIKNYQYYISTSNISQENGTWTNLESGVTQVTVSQAGTSYVYFRAINNVGTIGTISTPQTVKIDATGPSASLAVTGKTTKSVSLSATCVDNESGITKYEFSKDNGSSWTSSGTTSTYTFENLTTGSYSFKVKCTNGSELTSESSAVNDSTNEITAPTYSINTTDWATSKTVTITYPERQADFIYEYSIDAGSQWITVPSGTTVNVEFTANGSVIARIQDGVNTKTASTYTVDKIDSGIPTSPTLTGGSDTWTNSSRTISISTPSTSASGIKNYQYYISTSNTSQTGGTWIDLGAGVTSIDITTNGTNYIFMRAVNNAGTVGSISSPQTTMIDTGTPTAPTLTGGSDAWSTSAKTISVATPSTSTSGIKNYQYYISTSSSSQTGGTWTDLGAGVTSIDITTNGTNYIFMRAVNNAGTVGSISSPQTTMIDTGTPTAPTLTGGSDAWSTSAKTISVATPSTSTSGIKNYQYYISTSNSSQTGGTWTDLGAGVTSIDISNNGTNYIFMRAVNNAGTIGTISSPQTTKIDPTDPINISVGKGTVTSKSIQVTANGSDNESGITKYEYSKDDGGTWVTGTSNTYTFSDLTTGTYNVKVRLTNGSGLTTTSSTLAITTTEIPTPTYSIDTTDWATKKVVTITYPERQADFIYEYSTNGGSSWETVSSGTTASVTFTSNGSVIARVRDGVNTKTASTYTVSKIDTTPPTSVSVSSGSITASSIQVTANGTDWGSGIVKYEFSKDNGSSWVNNGTNRTYTFTGLSSFTTYNIKVRVTNGAGLQSVSNTTSIMTLERMTTYLINNKVQNSVNAGESGLVRIGNSGEITTSSSPREYRYIGPNPNNYIRFNNELWRIIGIFDGQLKIIRNESRGMDWDINDVNDWSKASLQTYLNNDYYGTINSEDQTKIDSTYVWKLGGSSTNNDVTAQMFYERERGTTVYSGRPTEWTGSIALMYPSDYGFATSGGSTTNRSSCLAKELYNWDSVEDCYTNSWLYDSSKRQWTLTPNASSSTDVFRVFSGGHVGGTLNASWADDSRPVVYLNSNVMYISGSGTSSDPYILQ